MLGVVNSIKGPLHSMVKNEAPSICKLLRVSLLTDSDQT